MDLYHALENRRSIRKYESTAVPRDKLQRILEAARVAPSWNNLQCWSFIVVSDPKKKEIIAESMPDNNPAKKAVGEMAPTVLVLCADPKASGNIDSKDYYLLDAGLAMQQLMLAAYVEELGTCWVAWFDEEKVRSACSVPDSYRIVALTPLGFPAKQPGPRKRKDLSEIVYQEKWGQPLG